MVLNVLSLYNLFHCMVLIKQYLCNVFKVSVVSQDVFVKQKKFVIPTLFANYGKRIGRYNVICNSESGL